MRLLMNAYVLVFIYFVSLRSYNERFSFTVPLSHAICPVYKQIFGGISWLAYLRRRQRNCITVNLWLYGMSHDCSNQTLHKLQMRQYFYIKIRLFAIELNVILIIFSLGFNKQLFRSKILLGNDNTWIVNFRWFQWFYICLWKLLE